MLISKSNYCPHCKGPHENECFVTYDNGYHCFSCGVSSIENEDKYCFKPRILQSNNVYLPDTIIKDYSKFPVEIMHWLYNYSLYKDDIKKYNIMYVPYDKFLTKSGLEFSGDSLIFPIINDDMEIVYYQRRFFPKKQILTVGNRDCLFVTEQQKVNSFSDTIILVEDYISAIRVGQICPCICLFGTSLKQTQLNYILRHYSNVITWLDGDDPGQAGAHKISKRFVTEFSMNTKSFSFKPRICQINNICTEKDPKEYTNTEIEGILSNLLD